MDVFEATSSSVYYDGKRLRGSSNKNFYIVVHTYSQEIKQDSALVSLFHILGEIFQSLRGGV